MIFPFLVHCSAVVPPTYSLTGSSPSQCSAQLSFHQLTVSQDLPLLSALLSCHSSNLQSHRIFPFLGHCSAVIPPTYSLTGSSPSWGIAQLSFLQLTVSQDLPLLSAVLSCHSSNLQSHRIFPFLVQCSAVIPPTYSLTGSAPSQCSAQLSFLQLILQSHRICPFLVHCSLSFFQLTVSQDLPLLSAVLSCHSSNLQSHRIFPFLVQCSAVIPPTYSLTGSAPSQCSAQLSFLQLTVSQDLPLLNVVLSCHSSNLQSHRICPFLVQCSAVILPTYSLTGSAPSQCSAQLSFLQLTVSQDLPLLSVVLSCHSSNLQSHRICPFLVQCSAVIPPTYSLTGSSPSQCSAQLSFFQLTVSQDLPLLSAVLSCHSSNLQSHRICPFLVQCSAVIPPTYSLTGSAPSQCSAQLSFLQLILQSHRICPFLVHCSLSFFQLTVSQDLPLLSAVLSCHSSNLQSHRIFPFLVQCSAVIPPTYSLTGSAPSQCSAQLSFLQLTVSQDLPLLNVVLSCHSSNLQSHRICPFLVQCSAVILPTYSLTGSAPSQCSAQLSFLQLTVSQDLPLLSVVLSCHSSNLQSHRICPFLVQCSAVIPPTYSLTGSSPSQCSAQLSFFQLTVSQDLPLLSAVLSCHSSNLQSHRICPFLVQCSAVIPPTYSLTESAPSQCIAQLSFLQLTVSQDLPLLSAVLSCHSTNLQSHRICPFLVHCSLSFLQLTVSQDLSLLSAVLSCHSSNLQSHRIFPFLVQCSAVIPPTYSLTGSSPSQCSAQLSFLQLTVSQDLPLLSALLSCHSTNLQSHRIFPFLVQCSAVIPPTYSLTGSSPSQCSAQLSFLQLTVSQDLPLLSVVLSCHSTNLQSHRIFPFLVQCSAVIPPTYSLTGSSPSQCSAQLSFHQLTVSQDLPLLGAVLSCHSSNLQSHRIFPFLVQCSAVIPPTYSLTGSSPSQCSAQLSFHQLTVSQDLPLLSALLAVIPPTYSLTGSFPSQCSAQLSFLQLTVSQDLPLLSAVLSCHSSNLQSHRIFPFLVQCSAVIPPTYSLTGSSPSQCSAQLSFHQLTVSQDLPLLSAVLSCHSTNLQSHRIFPFLGQCSAAIPPTYSQSMISSVILFF